MLLFTLLVMLLFSFNDHHVAHLSPQICFTYSLFVRQVMSHKLISSLLLRGGKNRAGELQITASVGFSPAFETRSIAMPLFKVISVLVMEICCSCSFRGKKSSLRWMSRCQNLVCNQERRCHVRNETRQKVVKTVIDDGVRGGGDGELPAGASSGKELERDKWRWREVCIRGESKHCQIVMLKRYLRVQILSHVWTISLSLVI